MMDPPLTPDEPFRLNTLRKMDVLDTPLEERFERITRLARRLFGVPVCAVSLIDADRQWFKSIQGLETEQTPRSVSFCGHTIQQHEILVVEDARKDDRFVCNPLVTGDPKIVFYAGCPLRAADGSAVGSLCLIDYEARTLESDDLAVLRDLAAMVEAELSAAVMNSVQMDLISQIAAEQRQALLDPLTRIWNREGIFNLLEHEIQRARKNASPFGLMMVDLDSFKAVNDTWGHPAGDSVLRRAAQRMLGAIRSTDAVGRYGGEEFMIVLGPCDDQNEVAMLAERVRERINETPIEIDGGAIDVTTSVGVAYAPPDVALNPDELLKTADAALYRAKQNGRNRVEFGLITKPNAEAA